MKSRQSSAWKRIEVQSGLYFAHPESRFLSLGKIGRDQVTDYARRKAMTQAEAERWLGPNLGYDPDERT